MSRILLLVLVGIWMAGPPDARFAWSNLAIFFSFYILMVLMLGVWSRMLARRVALGNFHRRVQLFNQVMFGARVIIPIWFMVGVWGLGWGGALIRMLGDSMYHSTPGLLLGTMPAFVTWMGLWWSQYPAERALREQNLLVELDNDLPVYQSPPFRSYFFSNFRLQVLFTLVPVAMIVIVRDVLMWSSLAIVRPSGDSPTVYANIEAISSLLAALMVFLFAPPVLARVLNTSPMPEGPLRNRLDAMCRRAGVRYRHILVWNTSNHVGNAAVMGLLPGLRYILLSDVLLERMSDRQIEAVFAHELGHVIYRHMGWYGLFFVMAAVAAELGAIFYNWGDRHGLTFVNNSILQGMAVTLGFAGFFMVFGWLSRRCERQADVYAARTMQLMQADGTIESDGGRPAKPAITAVQSTVGPEGAALFNSALRRVAVINNIPINPASRSETGFWNRAARYADDLVELGINWLHGSIAGRMNYIQNLSVDPRLTLQFDRSMSRIYACVMGGLVVCVVFAAFGAM